MSDTVLDALLLTQKQAILEKNKEFESRWEKTLQEFLGSIDTAGIAKKFNEIVKLDPFVTSVSHTLQMSLDGILATKTSYLHHGAIHYENPVTNIPVCSFITANPRTGAPYRVTHSCITGNENSDFDEYILGKMAPVRVLLRTAFPKANIRVSIDHCAVQSIIDILISYSLEQWIDKLPVLSERVAYDDFILW